MGGGITRYCNPITSYVSAITSKGIATITYCTPITSYLLAITSYKRVNATLYPVMSQL